jgi:hypothetical protein
MRNNTVEGVPQLCTTVTCIIATVRHSAGLVTVAITQPVVEATSVAVLTGGDRPGVLCVLSSPPPAISCGPLTVSSIPVTHGVVAGLVAVVVSDPVRGAALGTVGHWPGEVHLLTSLWCVEVLWPYWGSKHDIIIEIDEPLAEAWDAVEMSFYRRRTEGREMTLVQEYLLMSD